MDVQATQLNVAFYSFFPLTDLSRMRENWLAFLEPLGIKGTIILAPEGVNGFLAGPEQTLREALARLREFPALANARVKESVSEGVPFAKLSIKLKEEIVTFRVPEQCPPTTGAARLDPQQLRTWLDEGRDLVLLDTRNEYEARLGTFTDAVILPIRNFVDLPQAVGALPQEWKKKTVVTFCTGGIRCEKAAPFLASQGFKDVHQLEGGILGYFEAEGGKHWEGECFVFDERVALGSDLLPTGARLCDHCQWPIPKSSQLCQNCDH